MQVRDLFVIDFMPGFSQGDFGEALASLSQNHARASNPSVQNFKLVMQSAADFPDLTGMPVFSDLAVELGPVANEPQLDVYTYDQIAEQLLTEYWGLGGPLIWDVGADNTLTVNITALDSDAQYLAQQALLLWGDISGIQFAEVSGAAEISFFQDGSLEAYAEFPSGIWGNPDGSYTPTQAEVHISSDWLTNFGNEIGSYGFQTYIHEIGHALGLGHPGAYNGDGTYESDAVFANDAWSTSVMSYFHQIENSYFNNLGFSYAYLGTPMGGDVAAIGASYGLSATTRNGKTTYGFNSTSDRAIHDATQYSDIAYTIVDSSGRDTLNYSGFSQNQLIDLNPEIFMNIGGLIGNVVIGRGTIIEIAIGGSGNDLINGNDENNILRGNLGADELNGNGGVDRLYGGAQDDTLRGGNGDDFIFGQSGNDTIYGMNGDDTINGGDASDAIYGGSGDDFVFGGNGHDTIAGGSGNDQLKGNGGKDTITGGDDDDLLRGGDGDDSLFGDDGNDSLEGGAQNDTLTGGAGSDQFYFTSKGDQHADTITDFEVGQDLIVLDPSAFGGIAVGALSSGAFVEGTNATDQNDRIIYDSTTGELFYDSDGSGGASKKLFALVTVGLALSAEDFIIGEPDTSFSGYQPLELSVPHFAHDVSSSVVFA